MTCREFAGLLFEFRRKELTLPEMVRCRTHLASCAQCRHELADTEKFLSAVKVCCRRGKMPAALEERLQKLTVARGKR